MDFWDEVSNEMSAVGFWNGQCTRLLLKRIDLGQVHIEVR